MPTLQSALGPSSLGRSWTSHGSTLRNQTPVCTGPIQILKGLKKWSLYWSFSKGLSSTGWIERKPLYNCLTCRPSHHPTSLHHAAFSFGAQATSSHNPRLQVLKSALIHTSSAASQINVTTHYYVGFCTRPEPPVTCLKHYGPVCGTKKKSKIKRL